MKNSLRFAALTFVLLLTSNARADNPNVNMNDFSPSVHSWDIGNISTTRIAPHLEISGGLWMVYRKNALNLENPQGADATQLISDQLVSDLYFAVPLLNIASIGVDIPIFFVSSGDDPSAIVGSMSQAEGASFGDARLSGKVKFWDNGNKGFGVGLLQDLTLPTATGDKFTGEDTVTSRTALILDWSGSGFVVGTNLGYLARGNSTAFNPEIADELHLGLGVQIPIICDDLELLLANNTRTTAASAFESDAHMGSTFLGGLRVRPVDGLLLTGMGGAAIGHLPGTPEWEAMLNLGFEPKPNSCDLDGDGLCDSEDKCPTIPGPKVSAGCPDRDLDGVMDDADRCPAVPGEIDLDGCPDRDKDKIADFKDRCPDHPGPFETKGCPDTDGDGIIDPDDACPKVAGLKKFSGCPDTDGDGIEDEVDDCPKVPGPMNTGGCPDKDSDGIKDSDDKCPDVWGTPKYKGCPPPTPKKVKITKKKIVILDKVFFASNRAKIKRVSHSILKDVSSVLKDNPWVKKIRVEGHTDDVGKDKYNLELSQKRADAVKDFLIKEGVEAERIEAVGYGETKPLVEGKSKDARDPNRRVEFSIINPK